MMTKEQLHELRQQIDVLRQKVARDPQDKENHAYNRCMEKLLTHLEEAKMWGGKTLGTLGSELPPEYSDIAE